MFLYIITNLINKKQYVGITNNIAERWKNHCCGHGARLVWAAIQKYGKENLKFEILFEGSDEEIKRLECLTIATLDTIAPNGYNLTAGGDGLFNPCEETRQKISKSLTGKKQSSETIEKRRQALTGKQRTEEQKAKYSASHMGVIHSPEVIERIRVKNKGRKQTPEEREMRSKNSGKAKPILLYGIEYSCIAKAAKANRIPETTLTRWFRNWAKENNWPENCRYLT
jgi:group I intron endonuclease